MSSFGDCKILQVEPHGSFLKADEWETKFGQGYEKWRESRWEGSCAETRIFLEHILPLGFVEGEKRLLPHQAEAVQRSIYSFEHHGVSPLLCTLATGTGKTVVMGCLIAWLTCKGSDVNTFLVFCPNTIVRDRLKRDFESLNVFKEFNLIPKQFAQKLQTLQCAVVDSYQNCTNLLGKNLIVANRHQFQQGYVGGQNHLAFLQKEGGYLAIFNDEAHNTKGSEYTRTLKILQRQTLFRMDVTATPDRADGKRPSSHEIFKLDVVDAITGRYRENRFFSGIYPANQCIKLIKDVLVQRPLIEKYGAIELSELTFHDAASGRPHTVREINWEELPRKTGLQLVMDPGPMKMQLSLARQAQEKKRELANGRYKPLLFVIAPSILGAQQACNMMKAEFGLNPLLVVDELEEMQNEFDKTELRRQAAILGSDESPYDSVVSVYMLREGWDVPEVSVICLLRGFGSPLFAHQVLGRGLRLIRKNGLENIDAIQELTIIDHSCLQLDKLWAEIDALVLEGEEIVREREIDRLNPADESEKPEEGHPEEQLRIRPDLFNLLLPIPTPKGTGELSAERAFELLETALSKLNEYKYENHVLVSVTLVGMEKLRPQKKIVHSAKNDMVIAQPLEADGRDFAQKQLQKKLLDWAESFGKDYDAFVTQEDNLYRKFLAAFESHLFKGISFVEVDAVTLFAANHVIEQLREAVTFDFNRKIYDEEKLANG